MSIDNKSNIDSSYFWKHQKPTISKKKYSFKEIQPKKRFDFGENDE